MGSLYLALDPAIDRRVALKVLRVDNDEMRTRFLREARSAGRLRPAHIVTVHAVGEHDAPASVSACDGPFRVEIQSERVRFGGAGCSRASATAFVPVLCEGSSQWSAPAALRFGLRKTGETWSISQVDEIGPTGR